VAWNYYAAPGLAFTGGAHLQGDIYSNNYCRIQSVRVRKIRRIRKPVRPIIPTVPVGIVGSVAEIPTPLLAQRTLQVL
jgi:hypothetical protein